MRRVHPPMERCGMPDRNPSLRKRRLVGCGLFLVVAAVSALFGPRQVPSQAVVTEQPEFVDGRVAGGSLMIVGGGTVTSDIRRQFIELAGGVHARIVLIPGTDPTPEGEQSLLNP